jgi:flagellar biosynthesis protein FlhF
MSVKTYEARTMAEAIAAVKKDLGRDAVIVKTRNFRKGGLLGLIGGRSTWEVTALRNASHAADQPEGEYVPVDPARCDPGKEATDGRLDEPLLREVGRLRGMVETLLTDRQAPADKTATPELLTIADGLRRQDVQPTLVDEMIREVRMNLTGRELSDRSLIRERMRELIMSRLPIAHRPGEDARGGRSRVVALIGPTGVGKTTTIAKLAADSKLRLGKRVGLITIDTYRIAAVEQLRTYAEIIDVPLRVVLTPKELRREIQAFSGMDAVLIDTAGRSQNDRMRLGEMRRFLSAAEADEVHLVVSLAASPRGALRTVQQFGPLGVNRVIVTKLDEAETFGTILNVGALGVGEMSYVTTGQEVPDDIEPAEAGKMAEWILEGSFHAGG